MPRHAEAIADLIYKGIYWVFDRFFLPMHCRGKPKNFEIAPAFYCQRTKHLNFEDWVIDLQIHFVNRFALIKFA